MKFGFSNACTESEENVRWPEKSHWNRSDECAETDWYGGGQPTADPTTQVQHHWPTYTFRRGNLLQKPYHC